MARMLGRYQTRGCCPGTREGWKRTRRLDPGDCYIPDGSTRWRKRVEQREFARELRDQEEPIEAGDCRHGCNGGCVYGGSETCTFTCHDLTRREDDVFERLDRRAMELLNEEMIEFAEWSLPLTAEAAELISRDDPE